VARVDAQQGQALAYGARRPGLAQRIARLEEYERWRPPTRLDIEAILGKDEWEAHWSMCENVIAELSRCQEVADKLRARTTASLRSS
jgi:hypothetical protein